MAATTTTTEERRRIAAHCATVIQWVADIDTGRDTLAELLRRHGWTCTAPMTTPAAKPKRRKGRG